MTKKLDEIKNLESLKKSGINHIYKYLSLTENKLENILNNNLWASEPTSFNDKFDSQICLTNNESEELAAKHTKSSKIQIQYEDMLHFITTYVNTLNKSNISCFSECNPLNGLSSHMWGHYAGSGNGIALQYSIDDLIKYINSNHYFGCEFMNVAYHLKPTDNHMLNKKKHLSELIELHFLDYPIKEETQEIINNSSFTFYTNKSKQWEHEKEWRFISIRRWFGNYDCKYPFIEPSKIIFGWSAFDNKNRCLYKELKDWAEQQSIKYNILDSTTIDYETGMYKIKQ